MLRFGRDLSGRLLPSLSLVLAGNRATSTTTACSLSSGLPEAASVKAASPLPSISGGGQIDDEGDHHIDGGQRQNLAETAKRVCEAVLRRPRWGGFLLSEFSPSELSHPDCVRLVLCHLSSVKPLFSLHYLIWLSSHSDAAAADAKASAFLLEGLANAKAWKAAMVAIRSTNCQPDPPALESFLTRLILSKSGTPDEVLEAISLLKAHLCYSPPLAVWNSALSASLRAGRTDVVWRLYDMMLQSRIDSDAATAGYLVQAFCVDNKLDDAYRLLREVSRNGVVPDVVSITKLIAGFCKDGNYGKVSELIHLMIAGGCLPDIFTYQSIIHGLCRSGNGDEGFRIFKEIKLRGYALDLVTYTTMIDGLCKMGRMVDARNLWMEMVANGIEPNEYTYNVIIYGYCKAGDLTMAQKLYHEMCSIGFRESTVSCNIMIAGLCLHGRTEEALRMFEGMPTKGMKPDIITYNTLIQGFCKEGRIVKANKLYEKLLLVGLQPSTSTYTPLIQSLCEEGNMHGAVELMRCMKEKGLEPLVCTNDFIINGFCEAGKGDEGMAWLVNMLENNLRPQRVTINRLLEWLVNNTRVDDALLVLNATFGIGYTLQTSTCYLLVNQLCQENQGQAALQIKEILLSK
ncbi:pentatricopeptide repeat-containing protein [Canna indica]|uniref:Pentatricopeptide repeat-containing protein n=1 Tax=Canna indica TaxID=4628 RepID=A0AAQ3Q9B9_9LILI|nr:pentatricopeptide repeat-containing protein [Canna indica]